MNTTSYCLVLNYTKWRQSLVALHTNVRGVRHNETLPQLRFNRRERSLVICFSQSASVLRMSDTSRCRRPGRSAQILFAWLSQVDDLVRLLSHTPARTHTRARSAPARCA
ncbi:hypothetical protein J6590_066154 [Homalodisca vitripennis]|nr:hypothetical protein J6590_066154 [Homalodisca vitripennis]